MKSTPPDVEKLHEKWKRQKKKHKPNMTHETFKKNWENSPHELDRRRAFYGPGGPDGEIE